MTSMYGFGRLQDGTDPRRLGAGILYEDDGELYEAILESLEKADDSQHLAWFGKPGTGTMVPMNAERREAWKLPEHCAAVVWWNDNHPKEPGSDLMMLNAGDAQRIVSENECVAVDAIIDHYENRPDDGHPAYRLRRLRDDRMSASESRRSAST